MTASASSLSKRRNFPLCSHVRKRNIVKLSNGNFYEFQEIGWRTGPVDRVQIKFPGSVLFYKIWDRNHKIQYMGCKNCLVSPNCEENQIIATVMGAWTVDFKALLPPLNSKEEKKTCSDKKAI